MNRNFTLLAFRDINTCNIDLIDDAYGYLYISGELAVMLDSIKHTPDDSVIKGLLEKISELL